MSIENGEYIQLKGGDILLFDKIKALAEKKGVSIYRLEKEAELSKSSICKWNDNIPSVDKIQKVAKLLGVTVDSLLKEP
jgi:transcriptional regulator with XRE-family HTH domain